MRLAGIRYQATFKGKRNHASRQARYRMHQIEIVTHQGSPPVPQHASMNPLEIEPENAESGHEKLVLTCSFCKKPISDWIRNDFLRRRRPHASSGSQAIHQAP